MATESIKSNVISSRFHFSPSSKPTRTCLCSPTTHPGSFRCHLHRNAASSSSGRKPPAKIPASQIQSQWKNMSPSAKAKSVKAFLLQIIKPSSHDLQRRRDFKPKPSRFSLHHGSDGVAVS